MSDRDRHGRGESLVGGPRRADRRTTRRRTTNISGPAPATSRHPRSRPPHPRGRGRGGAAPGVVLTGEDLTPSRFLRSTGAAAAALPSSAAAPPATSPCSPARAACRWSSGSARSSLPPTSRSWSTAIRAAIVLSPGARQPGPDRCRSPRRRGAAGARGGGDRQAGGDRRRRAGRRDDQCRRPGRTRRLSPTICDGVGLVRTEFLFHRRQRPARRGGAIPVVQPHRRMGERSAGRHPHARRGGRQADFRADDRGERTRSSAPAASACRWRGRRSSASSCARWLAPPRSGRSGSCCRW